jgi:hypothetical protein
LYAYTRGDDVNYLRFYADGSVIAILFYKSPPPFESLNQYDYDGRGTYTIVEGSNPPQIKFNLVYRRSATETRQVPTFTYKGTIQNEKLVLEAESDLGYRGNQTYAFMPAPPPEPISEQELTGSKVGLMFQNVLQKSPQALNLGAVVAHQLIRRETRQERGIEYVNACPAGTQAIGEARVTDAGFDVISSLELSPVYLSQIEARAWFTSKTTPPAPGLRVVIRNASRSTEIAKMPFTDREYDKPPQSESFIVSPSTIHNKNFLAVRLGVNDFIYEIKRGEQVVESGKFRAKISKDYLQVGDIKVIPRPKRNLECTDRK